jgi:hypothetical protein
MAIRDTLTTFGNAFDLDQETGTYLLTNQVDLGAAGMDPGNGQTVYLNVHVVEAFTDGGDSATLQLALVSDDSAVIHDTTRTVHFLSGTILKAALTLGATFSFPIPVSGTPYERYLGVQALVATAGFDAGMITAYLSLDPIGWDAKPNASI